MPNPSNLTPQKDTVPIVQEVGWAAGPVWTGAENLTSPGYDSRTVQVVASRYKDWAIPVREDILGMLIKGFNPHILESIKIRMSNNFRYSWMVLQAVSIINTLETF